VSAVHAPRLQATTHEVTVAGTKLYLTVDTAADGSCAGLWLELHVRSDPQARSWANLWAQAATKALRCGCSLESVVESVLHARTEDGGPVQGDPDIRMCLSVVDYVSRRLAIDFMGRDDLRHSAG
jgi:ribonucleoside-diphosphate reductase alpha chain